MRDTRDSAQLYCTSYQTTSTLLAQTSAYYDDKSTGSDTGIWEMEEQKLLLTAEEGRSVGLDLDKTGYVPGI